MELRALCARLALVAMVWGHHCIAEDASQADRKITELESRLQSKPTDFAAQLERFIASCDGRQWTLPGTTTIDRYDWSGGCAGGLRHGSGTLSVIRESEVHDGKKLSRQIVSRSRAKGEFVAGQRFGFWCREFEESLVFSSNSKPRWVGNPNTNACEFRGADVVLRELTPQPQGGWRLPGEAGLHLPASYLESQEQKLLSAAREGAPLPPFDPVTLDSASVKDLLPQGRFSFRPAAIDLRGKRVAVVLSTPTALELDRFERDRQALLSRLGSVEQGSGLGKLADEFADVSAPRRLLAAVVKALAREGISAAAENDLAAVSEGRYDYALVLEWRSFEKFVLDPAGFRRMPGIAADSIPALGAWSAATLTELAAHPSLLDGQALGGLLFDSQLTAVRQLPLSPLSMLYKFQHDSCQESGTTPCDGILLKKLTDSYATSWLGWATIGDSLTDTKRSDQTDISWHMKLQGWFY